MGRIRYYVQDPDGTKSHLYANHHDAEAAAKRTGGVVKSVVAVYRYD